MTITQVAPITSPLNDCELGEVLRSTYQGSSEYELACIQVAARIKTDTRKYVGAWEVLCQLYEKPVWDGDVVSKAGRDALLTFGLISKVVINGEQGWQAMNYIGWNVYNAGRALTDSVS